MRFAPSLIILAAAAGGTVLPSAAHAEAKITQHILAADGHPSLTVNDSAGSPTATAWKACLSTSPETCAPLPTTAQALAPGDTPAGTRFEATTTANGVTTSALSKMWTGRVTNTAPPSLSGELKVGSAITATAGTWTGGWGDESSMVGPRACPTPAGDTGCVAMTAAILNGGPSSVVIDPAYAGWYVGAVDLRIGAGTAFPAIGYLFPPGQVSSHPAPVASQTVSHGPLTGPISPELVAPKQPRVTFVARKRAKRVKADLLLGTVTCPAACVAKVSVLQGTRKRVVTVRLKAAGEAPAVVRAINFRGKGKLKVSVRAGATTTPAVYVKR